MNELMCENVKSVCLVRLYANEMMASVKNFLDSVQQKD